MKVAVVDYGMGNLDSVSRAIEECGGAPVTTGNPNDLKDAAHIVLPGVGAFAVGMRNLLEGGFEAVLRDQAGRGVPILGVCLGMQLLGSRGTEGGDTPGLGLIPGTVVRLEPQDTSERVPHVGWNAVVRERECTLFNGSEDGRDYYFVHSYHLVPEDAGDIAGRTPYCGGFVSVVQRDAVFGVQFHPEKSQRAGFQVLRRFLSL